MNKENNSFRFTKLPELDDLAEISSFGKMDFLNDPDRFVNHGIFEEGGMKCLYRIEDTFTGKHFIRASLKNGKNSEEDILDFLNEAKITSILDHPNIPPVHEISSEAELPYFLMKLIKGQNLADLVAEKDIFTPSGKIDGSELNHRLEIFLKICDAISYAHSKSILHLDLKPANIVVGEFGEVYVCDWGLAIDLNSAVNDLQVRGTPGFMAPEQYEGDFSKLNTQTDIFSLGILLYCLIFKENPFKDKKTVELMKNNIAVNFNDSDILAKAPAELNKIILKAIEADQEERYTSVAILAQDVRNYMSHQMLSVESGLLPWFIKLVKRNPKTFSIAFIAAVLIFLTVSIYRSIVSEVTYAKTLAELESKRLQGLNNELIDNAAKEFYMKAVHLDNLYQFDESLRYIKMALDFNSTIPEAYLIRARMELGRLNFDLAGEFFTKVDSEISRTYQLVIEKALAQKTEKRKIAYLLRNLRNLQGGKRTVTYICISQKKLLNEFFTPYDLFKIMGNPGDRDDITYSEQERFMQISKDRVNDISFICSFDVDTLILSNVKDINLIELKNTNIKKLSLSHSLKGELWPLKDLFSLKELDISFCEINTLNALKNLSLDKLNTSGSKISNPQSILSLSGLKELICYKSQFRASTIDELLKRNVHITFSQRE